MRLKQEICFCVLSTILLLIKWLLVFFLVFYIFVIVDLSYYVLLEEIPYSVKETIIKLIIFLVCFLLMCIGVLFNVCLNHLKKKKSYYGLSKNRKLLK